MHDTISFAVTHTNTHTDTHAHIHLQTMHSRPQCKGFQFLHVFFNSCVLFCLDNICPKRFDGIISLICTFLMMGDVEHFYIYLLAICMSFFKEMLLQRFLKKLTLEPSCGILQLHFWVYIENNWNQDLEEVCFHVHWSIIHNYQDMETT